jgi:RNA polymerase sigma-70 factor (ECF subfamily)
MTTIEFEKRFQHFSKPLYSFALHLTRDQEDAKDLVQETAFRAFKNLDKFRTGTNFKAWMRTILRNSFINNYRKKRTRNQVEAPIEDFLFALESKTVHNQGVQKVQFERLEEIVEKLDDQYRIPFMLHFQGYQYKEISDYLDIPIGTVKSRIFFARKKLKQAIKRVYDPSEIFSLS